MSEEPTITINGKTLTTAQAMTVRVALCSFLSGLIIDDGLGEDAHGLTMTQGYKDRLSEIFNIMQEEGE